MAFNHKLQKSRELLLLTLTEIFSNSAVSLARSNSRHTHTRARTQSCTELEVIAVIFQLNTLVEKRWSCCCRKLELEKPVGSNREASLPHPFPCDVTDKSGEETEQKR